MRTGRRLAAASVVVAVLAAACSIIEPSTSLNYKLSVDVDENGTLRHGEGVIKVVFQSSGWLLIGNTPQWHIGADGEAFTIDFGPRGRLFVLLENDRNRPDSCDAGRGALGCYFDLYFDHMPNGAGSIEVMNEFAASHTAVDVAPKALPMLARFRDINDPGSVEIVDPMRLDASFGPGVRIVKARAEITQAPVTNGIEKIIPWVKNARDTTHLDNSKKSAVLIHVLHGIFSGLADNHFK